MTRENAQTLANIVGIIDRFGGCCRVEEYTDTDDVWRIFRVTQERIKAILEPYDALDITASNTEDEWYEFFTENDENTDREMHDEATRWYYEGFQDQPQVIPARPGEEPPPPPDPDQTELAF